MKKTVLSLAGLLAATAFAPEASAIPAFARQVGMACNACHAQHFPVLNSFGRAFKASGYTMMGAQPQIEGDHLSIPNTLNASILLKYRYQKDNRASSAWNSATGTNKGDGQWQMGDEFSLFFGGRVAENIGFIMENNVLNAGGNGNLVAGLKLPFVYEVSSAKLSVIPFSTDAHGAAFGFDQSSTGQVRAIRWAEHRGDISAQQYLGWGGTGGGGSGNVAAYTGQATGFALVALNDMGYINLTKWSPNFFMGGNAQAGAAAGVGTDDMKSTYVRIAATPTIGDWDMHIGAAAISGGSDRIFAANTRAHNFDVQAQGTLGGKDVSFYFTYAKAPAEAVGATRINYYNQGVQDARAWTIGGDYSVIPHRLHVGAAYRNARNGGAVGLDGDNSYTLMAIYDMYQNIAFHINHSQRSGSSFNTGGLNANQNNKYLTTFMLEAAW
jgi:hypothetical protein